MQVAILNGTSKICYWGGLLCILLFASCKKSTNPDILVLEGNYISSDTLSYLNAQLFTKDGEIIDQNIVKSYIIRVNQTKLTNLFTTDLKNEPFKEYDVEIDFQNKSEAHVQSISPKTGKLESVKYQVQDKSTSAFTLKAIDVIEALLYGTSLKDDALLLSANTIQPFSNCVYSDPSAGNISVCDYREEKPFVVKDGNIYKNYISFLLTRQIDNSPSSTYVFARAKFNTTVINKLAATDTLLIQNKRVRYFKR